MAKQGCRIIVLGDKRHEEVQGIVGQTGKKTLVIDHVSRIPVNAVKKIKKAAIVVQSTQNIDVIMPMVNALQGMINEVRFFNTICKPTQMKQAEMKTMPLRHDLVIIIGSRTSANTRRLYEISRTLNARSHWIESAREIRPAWFKGVKRIGITAGASTPQSATGAVIEKIIHLQKQSGRQLRNQSLL
jgi:4-hydroxy-3-methylbut-2-enyl diphosphate reductase